MLGLRYVACEACGRVTATPASETDVLCGHCTSDAVRDLGPDSDSNGDADNDGSVTYFASSMRAE